MFSGYYILTLILTLNNSSMTSMRISAHPSLYECSLAADEYIKKMRVEDKLIRRVVCLPAVEGKK